MASVSKLKKTYQDAVKLASAYVIKECNYVAKSLSLLYLHYYYNYYNHFKALWILFRTTRASRHQKGKTYLDFLEQETVSGSGISWAICKFAPRSRQITMPAPHHSVFTGWMPFLPPNQ